MTPEKQMGRELRTIVEIEQDFCQLAYGVAPCAAALGVTGDRKCFNTRATCQDPDHYTPGKLTVRFCKPSQTLPSVPAIPLVVDVTTAPTEINPGGAGSDSGPLGKRARVTVTFQDAPHSDIGVDPYVAERGYRPMERGTFWSKWLARNPYYNNRVIRIREGYVGQGLEDMTTRTYLIDKIDGPDTKGRVKITARDILALADNNKAQAPAASTGELIADIDDSSTAPIRITGAVAADYPAPGTVRINDELITYTTTTTVDETEIQLSGITRHTDGTDASSQSEGDRVQICLRYESVRVDALAREWLVDYGGVPAEFIPWADWQAEADTWLAQFDLTGLITEPTGVQDLLAEITEQCLFYVWWDERAQLIRLAAIKPPQSEVALLTGDANILADSAELSQDPSGRWSQVWVYWGQRDPTEKLDKESNYRHIRVRADEEAESADQYGEQRIKKVFSRWLHSEAQAINVTTRLLNRYRDNPQYMTLDLDAKDREHWTGDVVDVEHRTVVDDTGLPVRVRWQIVSAEEKEPGHSITYKLFAYEFKISGRPGYWMPIDAPDYASATDEEKAAGAWWSDENGFIGEDKGFSWI
jgi:hypothetical protein